MGRLIDADELTNVMTQDWFLDILLTQNGKSDLKEKLVDMIDSVPLAYDVEKVVAEIGICSGNGYRDVDGDYVPPMIRTKEAIDIVRKGGINE